MARKPQHPNQKPSFSNPFLLWVSHLMTFGFGVFAGIMMAQVGWGTSSTSSTPSAAPQASNDQSAAVIQQLESHLTHAPDDLEARIQLGNAYFDAGKYESAILHYSKALEMKPRNPNVIVDLGIAYRHIGRSDVAVQKFREALAIDAQHVNARYNLGVVSRWDLNDLPAAIAAWDTLLLYHPNHPNAATVRAQLAEMRSKEGVRE
jgi:cytochrome c-type biogenesis protein CcmH/NrfG